MTTNIEEEWRDNLKTNKREKKATTTTIKQRQGVSKLLISKVDDQSKHESD